MVFDACARLDFPRHRSRVAAPDLRQGLTISTNLFGTTYYSLVGLHAFHVTVGLIALLTVLLLALFGNVPRGAFENVEVLALLALRRCGLGGRFHRRVHCWPLAEAIEMSAQTNRRVSRNKIAHGAVDSPAPTAWPIVLAFGITLLFAGLITSLSVRSRRDSLRRRCIGWFFDVFPREAVEVLGPWEPMHDSSPRARRRTRWRRSPNLLDARGCL